MGQSDCGDGVGSNARREERVAEGVSIRRDRDGKAAGLRIAFMYRGVECRERLDLAPTTPNIRYAVNRRGSILTAIAKGTFNYADEFPESPRARRFGFFSSDLTVGALLDQHEALTKPTVEASTWLGYSKIITRCLRPWFGNVRVRDLTPAMIRDELLADDITLKTARNILSVLNVPLERAVADGAIETNPVDRVKLKVIWPKDRRESGWRPDPFAFEEMQAIFAGCRDEEEADYWRYAFGSGFRPSEQIALPWALCDRAARAVRIEVAEVIGVDGAVLKGPKTVAGRRGLPLTMGAWEALERQWARTGPAEGRVWRDARYNAPWRGDTPLRKRFTLICKAADVRYRNPYQTRHTFASTLLAAGEPPLKVAMWMGHETTEMLERNYGRWIEQGQDPAARAALATFFSPASPTIAEVVQFRRRIRG